MSLYITLYNTSKNRLITYESPTLSIDCPSLENWLGEKPNFLRKRVEKYLGALLTCQL